MRSFDELLEFLLDQIALKGDRGASISDFHNFVESFCNLDATDARGLPPARSTHQDADRKFVEKVWEWLVARADIWVGKNREGNALTLSEAERWGQSNNSVTVKADVRIYTTQSRIWQALTGHGIDLKRILAMEFQLLSAIAAAGPLGITQPELVKATGQDKRSVPKRTQDLQDKGYIDKKTVYEKGLKTSLLVLKRYINQPTPVIRAEHSASTAQDAYLTSGVFVGKRLVLDNFLTYLVDKVGSEVIPLENLIADLGVKEKQWERRMIYRCLDRLDIIGLISRFRAVIKASRNKTRHIKSIQLLHEPTDADKQKYHALTNELRAKFRENLEVQDAIQKGVDDGEAMDLDEDDHTHSPLFATDPAAVNSRTPNLPEVEPVFLENAVDAHTSRTLAQWDPALPYPNLLFNTTHPAGPSGLASMDATAKTYGEFYNRSVDSMLGRMTDDWEHSQPPHLMHLALIRDTAVVRRINYYLYRSYPNFEKAVEAGDAVWEAVRVGKGKASTQSDIRLDERGFPVIPSGQLLRVDGSASVADAVKAASREKLPERQRIRQEGEPRLDLDSQGNEVIIWPLAGGGRGPRKRRVSSEDGFTSDMEGVPSGTASRPTRPSITFASQEETPRKKYDYPRPETVKGMSWSAYNRQYREKKNEEKFEKKRMERIRRHAEQLVDREERQPPSGDSISLIDVPAAGVIDVTESPIPRKRGRPTKEEASRKKQKVDGDAHTASPVANQTPSGAPPRLPRVNAAQKRHREQRVEELVMELSDTSRIGLHLDPPGSRPHVGWVSNAKGKRNKVMVLVFKFPWLQELDWFRNNPGKHYEPKEQDPTTPLEKRQNKRSELAPTRPQQTPNVAVVVQDDLEPPLQISDDQQHPEAQPPIAPSPLSVGAARTPVAPEPEEEWPIGFRHGYELLVVGEESRVQQQELRSLARRPCGLPSATPKRKRKAQHRRPAKRRKTATWTLNAELLDTARLELPDPIVLQEDSQEIDSDIVDMPAVNGFRAQDISADAVGHVRDPNQNAGLDILSQEEAEDEPRPADTHEPEEAYPLREQALSAHARRKRGVGVGGGSSRAKRINIIVDIVNKCGGVFGGDTEIIRAYQDYHLPDSQDAEEGAKNSGLTDRDTIIKALKAAVSDGKVKRAAWAFKDRNGFAVTKKLLLRPDMSIEDPVAIAFRKKIEDAYPVQYIPEFLLKRKRGGIEKPQAKVISRYIAVDDEEHKLPEEVEAQWMIDHRRRQEDMEKRKEERRLQRMRDWWQANKNQVPKTPRGRLRKLVRQETRKLAASLRPVRPAKPLQERDGDTGKTRRKYMKSKTAEEKQIAAYEAEASAIPGVMRPAVWAPPQLVEAQTPGQELEAWNHQIPDVRASGRPRSLAPKLAMLSSLASTRDISKQIASPTGATSEGSNVPSPTALTLSTVSKPPKPIGKGSRKGSNKKSRRKEDTGATPVLPVKGALEEALGDLKSWQKEGYDMRVLGSGASATSSPINTDGFVNFSLNHSHVTITSLARRGGPPTGSRLGDHFATDETRSRGPISVTARRSSELVNHMESGKPAKRAKFPKAAKPATPRELRAKLPKDRRNVRGNPACVITPVTAKRLLFGVIAVRSLAGGSGQAIHWPAVYNLFKDQENFDETTFRKRWAVMLQYHQEVVDRVEIAFQTAFVAAYEKDEVPRLNNASPGEYDWDAIVKWAAENVMIDSRDIDLPANSDDFDRDFVVTSENRWDEEAALQERTGREMATILLKETATTEMELSVPLFVCSTKRDPNRDKQGYSIEKMEMAKSWARAYIMTSNEHYDADSAAAKLERLEEPLLDRAMQELQDEKMIIGHHSGRKRPSSGRSFHQADAYMPGGKKAIFFQEIARDRFVEAVAMKQKLDTIFAVETEEDRVYVLPNVVDDGEVLCITDLAAHGRVVIKPLLPETNNNLNHSPPRISIWGLGEGIFYGTGKYIDMNLLRWKVEVRPTGSYVFGSPTIDAVERTKPPMYPPGDKDGMQRIPYWVDIHGNFVQTHWENVTLSVVQQLAIKAGGTVNDMRKAFRGLLWDWEIQLVVDWLVDVGVAKWTEKEVLRVEEWWWSLLAASSEISR